MSSEDNLEVEEFENVPLVRMEDVQPSRTSERVVEDDESSDVSRDSQTTYGEPIETYIVDGSEIHCGVDDDHSNIGSMVSVKTDYDDEAELIVPEVLDTDEENLVQKTQSPPPLPASVPIVTTSPSGSWPTLEISPGGVINLSDKASLNSNDRSSNEMMYACAKCPERFDHLMSLVKHVRLHKDEERRNTPKRPPKAPSPPFLVAKKDRMAAKIKVLEKRSTEIDKEFVKVTRVKPEERKIVKKHQIPVVKEKYVCLQGGTIKLLNRPKSTKVSKKSS